MSTRTRCAYGAWVSPITAGALSGQSLRLGSLGLYHGRACWLEGRPGEGGRSVLVTEDADGRHRDLIPAPWNIRSRVHEYGGGACRTHGDWIVFSHDADQRLYRMRPGGPVEAVSAADRPWCFADICFDPRRERIVCVREDHGGQGEPRNELVAIDLATGRIQVLARGRDFYSSPCLAPSGRELAYLSWNHPNMPWDGTCLWRATLSADGALENPRRIAGGDRESIFQPQWSPRGELYFSSDRSGYWNLYREAAGGIEALAPMAAECGLPQWQFAMSTYGFSDPETLVMACCDQGIWRVQSLHLASGRVRVMPGEITSVSQVLAAPGRALVLGASADQPLSVLEWDLAAGRLRGIQSSAEAGPGPEWISKPRTVSFTGTAGASAHGFYYPPRNPRFEAPDGERPPLMVIGHGGPTGATTAALSPGVQFWTTRGFAVLDVNYRGSTGYGRGYRALLEGGWGRVDVEDCVNGARAMVSEQGVDPERLAIRGSSAGGYTTLAALVFHDVFRAGASYYGIGELESLARDTHKFESRYLDRLIGPYPQAAAEYRARSPIHHVEQLSCPVIFFQGLEDKVVPPNQALRMRDALRAKGIPVACLLFEGEQHGFRQGQTIRRALQAELYFYGRVFGFRPADELPQIEIENL